MPWLARMRAETPVWVNEQGARLVFRHADVRAVLADPGRFSSNLGRIMPFLGADKISGNLLWADPPAHRLLRTLVSQAFTPAAVAPLRGRITAIAADLLATIDDERFDLVDAFASPLPIIVIAELLGVSPGDRDFFRDCADRSLGLRIEPGTPQDELAAVVTEATKDLDAYLTEQIRHRRATPAEDLLTVLATGEVDGEPLREGQACVFATLLLTAGYVTTTLLIGNALLCLREAPGAEQELRAQRALVPAAIEEVLRMRPPVPQTLRLTNEDVVLGDVAVPANSLVALSLLSANHDEREFDQPERFDPRRDVGRHLAFGHGIHFCLGAPLARLETEIALNLLFDTFPRLHVEDGVVGHDTEFYGPKHLPVSAG